MACNRVASPSSIIDWRGLDLTVDLLVSSLKPTVTDPFLKTLFDTLLKQQEVIRRSTFVVALAYNWISVIVYFTAGSTECHGKTKPVL